MKKHVAKLIILSLLVVSFTACEKESEFTPEKLKESVESSTKKSKRMSKPFVHGIVINIDGEGYYFAGPPDGPNGEIDVPGHYWKEIGRNRILGKHYNTGPFGTPNWWSSDADNGALLYEVQGVIDTWSLEKAQFYALRGFVHRHEFVSVSTGEFHPNKVVWLRHIAVTSFTLDGGPGAPNPPYEHFVTPGVDYEFPVNGFMPYPEVE